MKLTPGDLAKVLTILEKIDRGLIHPRFPDRVGRFLRQYRTGRRELDKVLAQRSLERRADAAISGQALQAIEVHPLLEPQVSVLGFPLGEVADSLAISEELGGLNNVIMWMKGPVANAALNILRENPGVRLTGDYRWTPPSRVTPGEAIVEASGRLITWKNARCLKAVADDLGRPPHALEYVLDYRLGPPGIKYFRCVCVVNDAEAWHVLPALKKTSRLTVAGIVPEVLPRLRGSSLAALLIYREPWSSAWTIVDGVAIAANDAFAHAVTWADFQSELVGSHLDPQVVGGIRHALKESSLRPTDLAETNLERSLFPASQDVIRWLHGFA